MPLAARLASERIRANALILRRAPVGDADLMVTLFTDLRGVVSVAARSARRASSRLGALEPIHRLAVTIEIRPQKEVGKLVEASVEKARLGILGDSQRMDWAFRVLLWVRRLLPPNEPEPIIFDLVDELFDALEQAPADCDPRLLRARVVGLGFEIVRLLGYGVELEACATCRTPCPPNASAYVDIPTGGVICRACGGAASGAPLIRKDLLNAIRSALEGELLPIEASDESRAFDLVERAVASESGAPRSGR